MILHGGIVEGEKGDEQGHGKTNSAEKRDTGHLAPASLRRQFGKPELGEYGDSSKNPDEFSKNQSDGDTQGQWLGKD